MGGITKAPELPALTGIRFFAALLVFVGHCTNIPGMHWLVQYRVFGLASSGVATFFVLSGFILTYNYARLFADGVSTQSYGKFVWDRLSKIYPLYFLTLALCIPIQIAGQRAWNWQALGLHVTLLQCMLPIQHFNLTDYFNIPGWSISCEMLFYVLAPFLIWRALAFRRLPVLLAVAGTISILILAAAASVASGLELNWPARFAFLRVPEFILGVTTAVCYLRSAPLSRTGAALFIVGGLTLLSLAEGFAYSEPRVLNGGPLCAPGAVLLIYGLARTETFVSRVLSHRWIVLLGLSSFAFYLVHDPLLRICKGVMIHYGWSINGPWGAALFGLLLFLVVQAISIWLFKNFEMPVQNRLRSLVKKKARPATPPARFVPSTADPSFTNRKSSVSD